MSKKNNVWVYVQQDEGIIAEVSLELICKARELAKTLNVKVGGVIIGKNVSKIAETLFQYGCDDVYYADNENLHYYSPLPYAKIMVDLVKKHEPQIVLFGATSTGRDVAPRVASELRCGLTADCTALEIGDHKTKDKEYHDLLLQIRPAFGGNIIATIVSPDHRPQMATVREGVMKLEKPGPGRKGQLMAVDVKLDQKDLVYTVVKKIKKEKTVNLKGANIIVSGGIGVGSIEGFRLIRELASLLGAEVGASRAAVDSGFIDREHQVGQTGTTVRPRLYIACGISGSVQHRAGMDQAHRIIAINSDQNAPIFDVAHYGIVGDLHEVIPMFINAYKEKV